jgi:hypothetical protein
MVHCSIHYCPFICPWVSSRKGGDGGRVHAKDKIIRNSILQGGSGLWNVVEANEWDMDAFNFSVWSIWRSWNSNGVCMAKLWPFYGYNIGGQTVNATFRVTWSHRGAILHHSEWPIIFRVHKHNEDELLRTLSSKNNASASEKVRVVAGWVIEHVKHEFFGFDATKSLLLLSRLNL